MNWLLFLGLFLVSSTPLFAQAQPDPAKVKADAQKVVSVIKGDKAKTQAYCEINDLGEQIGEANHHATHCKNERTSRATRLFNETRVTPVSLIEQFLRQQRFLRAHETSFLPGLLAGQASLRSSDREPQVPPRPRR
jgi:hypothetical protein